MRYVLNAFLFAHNLLGLRLIEKADVKTTKKLWWENGGMGYKSKL
jgi:hypothetical protein